mgnify:CR=1 FL=1
MKLSFMRMLERHLGTALLRLVSLARLPVRLLRRAPAAGAPTRPVRTVLVQKYFGVGSIFCAIPLLDLLRKAYPEARIVILTFAANRPFLEIIARADEILTVDSRHLGRFILDNLQNLFRLRSLGVDVSIDLEFFTNYSMLVSYLSGAPVRSGFSAYHLARGELLTHPAPLNHYKHITRAFLATAQSLGLPVPEEVERIDLPRQGAEARRAARGMAGAGEGGPLVVVNPNASDLCHMRRWPGERFAELMLRLAERMPEARFALVGSPAEKAYVDSVAAQCAPLAERLTNLAGRTSLRQLLALLEACDLFVSNDSGPAHLAAGFQTPSLVLFGPETPTLYRPINANCRIAYKNLYCSPCINVLDNKNFETCRNVACMRSITVADALARLEDMLPRSGAATHAATDKLERLSA